MVRLHQGSLLNEWSVGVLAARLLGTEEDRVQFRNGPLDDTGRWSNGKTLGLHPGDQRFASVPGFDSPAVHWMNMGSWSNGTTPARQAGDPGSIPGGST
jgi:hypothetical protein